MTSLASYLSGIVGAAFEEAGLPAELGLVRVSDRPDLAQFQCNGAMAAAKQAGKNPREVAQVILDHLKTASISLPEDMNYVKLNERSEDGSSGVNELVLAEQVFEKLEIAGPGFLNIDLKKSFISSFLALNSQKEKWGFEVVSGDTVILDYGGMNVAKAMHVGHLRSLVIGGCLKNLMRYAGYEALGDIHMGDWGLQMGQIISAFELEHPEWPYFDPDFSGEYPVEAPFSYEDLEEIYPKAAQACKDDPERLAQARTATMELQAGRTGYLALWQHFIDLSIVDIKANIARLNVDFELWKGEACVNNLIPEITQDLAQKSVTIQSDGAVVIPVAEEDDKEDIPPLMFAKSDGAATYGTTDIATIYDRIKEYPGLVKIIYETDLRQNLHFEQVFRAARKAGYAEGIELIHIGHGTVNGPDGKPFKTREGKAMKFADMVEAVVNKAKERLEEADLATDESAEERENIAQMVAVSVLKFTELSNQPHMDYIFDIDRVTRFEGKTGPYLLYQAVRIQSLLKKAEAQGDKVMDNQEVMIDEADQELALLLCEFPDHLAQALKHYSPHILCDYAYRLASAFSSFYGNCHILSEENEAVRASRLALCAHTHRMLVTVLGLLGIAVPDRM